MPLTASQAKQQLASKNFTQADVPVIPQSMRDLAEANPVYIFNVGPKEFMQEMGSMGKHLILACPEGERYSTPRVIPGVVYEGIPVDIKKLEYRQCPGMDLAMDIVGLGPFKKAEAALTHWGVFISRSNPPKDKEIEQANQMLLDTCLKLVREGDDFHNAGPQEYRNISADHRWALRKTNLNRAWGTSTLVMEICPGCQDSVKPGVVVHGCGAVLDWDKAIELGIKKDSDRPVVEGKAKKSA